MRRRERELLELFRQRHEPGTDEPRSRHARHERHRLVAPGRDRGAVRRVGRAGAVRDGLHQGEPDPCDGAGGGRQPPRREAREDAGGPGADAQLGPPDPARLPVHGRHPRRGVARAARRGRACSWAPSWRSRCSSCSPRSRPKTYAVQHPERAAMRVTPLLWFLTHFAPLRVLSTRPHRRRQRRAPGQRAQTGPVRHRGRDPHDGRRRRRRGRHRTARSASSSTRSSSSATRSCAR